jgi:hypothetical protein
MARAEGKKLVIVETNVRELSDPLVGWGMSHGAVLGAVGLALSGRLSRVYIASANSYDQLHPWGSHPLLDPLWSSAAVAFLHDGNEARRADKVVALTGYEPALESLRVCWGPKGEEYNCGACEKCLRTMLALHVAGALQRCKSFRQPLNPKAVGGIRLKKVGTLHHAMEILERLRLMEDPFSRQLFRALRGAIRRGRLRMAFRALRRKLRQE